MAIIFDEENKVFHLQTAHTSYMMGIVNDEYLFHIYYGKKRKYTTPVSSLSGYNVYRRGSFAAMDYGSEGKPDIISSEVVCLEYPTYTTDLREPALHAEYADGTSYTRLSYQSHRIYPGKQPLEGMPSVYVEADGEADTLEITLKDVLKGLTVTLTYTVMTAYDAICRSVRVTNDSDEAIRLRKVMSASVDLYGAEMDMTHLYGMWARERHIERRRLIHGIQGVDSKRGSSSHHHNPFMMLSSVGATEDYGDVYGFSLVYSGNFEAKTEVSAMDITRAMIGINGFDFSWHLAPGESFTAPEAVLVYSDEGFGEMSRRYHKLYRERLCRGKFRDAVRPVLINNWEATYFNFSEEVLLNIARKAKEADIDLLVLDDGWFGRRDYDNSSLGDWTVYREKLPCGIDGLAKKVNALGMKFGLWFEPEMVSPDSELYRAHPDWCIHLPGRGRSLSRNQLILDLSRPEVCDYIIEAVGKILTEANVEYVKWDMNRNMSEIGNELLPAEKQRELPHRYMLGLYRVLETLTKKFPHVLFEGCSGGGGRFDPAMLAYFPQIWTSDDSDAVERLYIQEGTGIVYPASAISAHVSAVPNHQVGRVTPIATRGAVAMTGQFGYELDLNKLSEEEFGQVKEQVALYKEISPIIRTAGLYRLKSAYTDGFAAWEYASEDRETVILMMANTLGCPAPVPQLVKLKALDPDAVYKERYTGAVYRGEQLLSVGVTFTRRSDFTASMMIFEKQPS